MRISGSTVARLRWSRGWGITDLSDASGLSENTISRIEAGESRGTPKSALKLAQCLGVDVLDIICEDDEPIPSGAVGSIVEPIRRVG